MNLDDRNNAKEQGYKDSQYEEGMEILEACYPEHEIWDLHTKYIKEGILLTHCKDINLLKHELANLYANGEISL